MNDIYSSWRKTFFASVILLAFAIIFHGLLIHGSATLQQQQENRDGTLTVSTKNAPIWGKKDAPITIIEFSDFDCPFCKKAYDEVLPQLKSQYIDTGKVRFIYRNAPLQIHTEAKLKAAAALCSRKQKSDEGFYAMHNALYEKTSTTKDSLELLEDIAKEQKLDVEMFMKCAKHDTTIYDQIDLDIADAIQVEGTGTPTWFIGKTDPDTEVIHGIRIVGSQPFSVFRILINQLLSS